MAANALDAIRRGLAEVWESQGRTFVTFEVEDDDDLWIQFIDGQLNVRWPLDEKPAAALSRLGVIVPRGVTCGPYRPGETALFATGDASIDDVARFVDALFARVVVGRRGYRVAARVERDR